MRVSVNLFWATAEAMETARQTVDQLGEALTRSCDTHPSFENMERLVLGLDIHHPLSGTLPRKTSGSYHKATKTFHASAGLNYSAWVSESWAARVEALAFALTLAVAAVHKTRITAAERGLLLDLLNDCSEHVKANTPARLVNLKPVHLIYDADSTKPAISFSGLIVMPAQTMRIVLLEPHGIADYLAQHPDPGAPDPEPFKLYRKSNNRLEYHEAWPTDDGVVEHWGVCGERGKSRDHNADSAMDQQRLLSDLKSKAKSLGFKAISSSRHIGIVIERPIDGFGTPAELEERHALEVFLDELTGWLGLGRCEGGSIGSGSMEAFCRVVDFPIACEAIVRELRGSPFAGYHVKRERD